MRVPEENLLGCDTFRDLGDLARQHHGHRLNHEMNVVLIGSDLDKVHVVSWGKLQTNCFERCFHGFRKDLSAVFSRTDEMVEHAVDVVAFLDVFRHTSILPHRAGGPAAELTGKSSLL